MPSTMPQKEAFEVMSGKVKQTEERFAGYQDALMDVLGKIIENERNRPHRYAQRSESAIENLGEKLEKHREE